MQREKLTVTWDDVRSPVVDAKLREQETKSREDAFTSPALAMNDRQLKTQQRTSIWYNTVFTMAVFGLLGGLVAWGAGELIQLRPLSRPQYLAQLHDAQDKWEAVQSVQRRYDAGIDRGTAQFQIDAIRQAAADEGNVYFPILANRALATAQKQERIAQQHANYETKAFIAKVLAYGLIGMVIALALSVAEPVVDRNTHGALVNGAVGAMLGLFGGVLVSLFVDRLHQALGGSDNAELTTVSQTVANSVKYGVIGMFLLVAPGVLMRNGRKLAVGLAGGLVGGLIGGALFAPVAKWTGNAMLSRAVATVAAASQKAAQSKLNTPRRGLTARD